MAIKKLTEAGFNVTIATNQACISKKIIDEKQLQIVHDHMSFLVQEEALILESDTETIESEINEEPEVQLLERQLQKAIDKEEYEMAARIRDKIKQIDT